MLSLPICIKLSLGNLTILHSDLRIREHKVSLLKRCRICRSVGSDFTATHLESRGRVLDHNIDGLLLLGLNCEAVFLSASLTYLAEPGDRDVFVTRQVELAVSVLVHRAMPILHLLVPGTAMLERTGVERVRADRYPKVPLVLILGT